jgi:hypothetical protein
MVVPQESDECDCSLCTEDAHAWADRAQLEYFQKRDMYRKLSHKDLIDSLKEFGVPEVLREVIESRLAGMESV